MLINRLSCRFLALALKGCLWVSFVSATLDINRMVNLAHERFGEQATETVNDWQLMLITAEAESAGTQLQMVNDFFNSRVRWTTDQAIYQTEDYWATPLETLGRLAGDCEDFSIAKFASLRELGIPAEQLRLIYVKAISGGLAQAHMVLAWYETPRSVPLILDNINQVILPANQRRDLQPVFSFNSEDLWLGATGNRVSASPQARMSRWRQVLDQMRKEGLEG